MIQHIRLVSHQLSQSMFEKPEELVNWMGAVQAQDYVMAKWALGVRLCGASVNDIDNALKEGKILRTHILRPTWHFISANDIRWMIMLNGKRIKTVFQLYGKSKGIIYDDYIKASCLLEKVLTGKSLAKHEITVELNQKGFGADIEQMNCLLTVAETEGVICSGIDKNRKPTYALLEERVKPVKALSREEALAMLATKYYQSHSPASLNDFVWWSGLSVTEARKATETIKTELITEQFNGKEHFVHINCRTAQVADRILHLLPAFDEYLISYKDRTDVLDSEYFTKAFTKNGIFHSVILFNGKITGTWKKTAKKSNVSVETLFFDKYAKPDAILVEQAIKRYKDFFGAPKSLTGRL